MEKMNLPTGANTGASGKGEDYWYFKKVAVPLFNEEVSLRTSGKKPVTYALFAQLFLAPMMLPHHNAGGEPDILQKQLAFLDEYRAVIQKRRNLSSTKPGRRAEDVLSALLEKDGSHLLDAERSNTKKSQPYAVRSSSYAAPERYLSFFRFLDREPAELLEERVRGVEELYGLELELIFQNHMEELTSRLRFLLSRLPEDGEFVLRGGKEAPQEAIRARAGRVLSCALLWAAAEKVNDWEVYDLLRRRFGMPMPASTGTRGRPVPVSASVPFSVLTELCAALSCQEELSPRTIQALMPLLEALPGGVRPNSVRAILQVTARSRQLAFIRVASEKNRELRMQFSVCGSELDQLEGTLETMLGESGGAANE